MEQLGIDVKQIVAQLINFVLFFLIFKKFIATPFTHFLNEEQSKEKEAGEILAKLKKDEENLAEKQLKIKQEVRLEMEKVLAEAKKQAEVIKLDLIKEAKNEAEEIKTRGKKQLTEEKEKFNQSLKERLADLSIAIVNKAFQETLDEETRRKITKYILANLEKDVVSYEN